MSPNNKHTPESIDTQLAELQKGYISKLSEKLQAIMSLWNSSNKNDTDELHKLYRAVHSVAGTSAMLNIDEVHQICAEIELILLQMLNPEADDVDDHTKLHPLFSQLQILLSNNDFKAMPINLNEHRS
ncbi:Hpt domain-containing protein [Zhongshania aliphaticivorans]|uniref:Hpt domain-containing protein n=1 Tax=Zhongshania aliphaticivorans TaxID=1470434 RepID=UPI0012E4AB67|nr:Hpt domain-containing protein [Zhongshania aliphaticivorans]CAA0103676.1 Uncharacterised protein [Zhongshania aliphaticivorans]